MAPHSTPVGVTSLQSVPADLQLVIDQLHRIEADRKAKAALALPDGDSLEVSNLHKIFWPGQGLTKGDLMRTTCRSRLSSCRW